MSTLLDEPLTRQATSPAQRLRTTMAAVRISFTWLGTRKTLTSEQKAQAADTFGAEQSFLSAGKKLLDTSDPSFKAVTSVRGRTINYWKGITLPYPEAGIRLIRQDDIAMFDVQLTTLKAELDEAVWRLDSQAGTAVTARFGRLGTNGQQQTKSLPTLEAAERHVEKLVGQKLAKGYVECVVV